MRSIYTESRIDSYRYYHLSKDDGLTVLKPSIPNNYMTRNKYEDSKTPRVSFAPSINQCLMGMSKNLVDEEFYVYTPYLIDLNKLKKPYINQVPDVEITGEVWATQDIKVKKVGKIKVIKDAGKEGHPYVFGNEQKAELYDWEYKVLIDESVRSLEEITKEDLKKNKLLKPVFIVNTYTGSAFGDLMKATLKFEYTHALIALDSGLSQMYSFDNNKIVDGKLYKGFIQDNFSRYKKNYPEGRMRVTCVMVTDEIMENIHHSINYYKKHEKKTAYSYFNLFKWIAGSNKISSWGNLNMFCSEFVDTILKHNNIDITGKSAINASPDDLGKFTGRNNSFIVFEGFIKDYNPDEVDKKIEDMKKKMDYSKLFTMTDSSMKSRQDIMINKKNHTGEIVRNIVRREDVEIYDPQNLHTEKDTKFELPGMETFKPDIQTLFDNTDPKHIWFTSDWHFFKNHYKKEANYVNTKDILVWCRKNLTKDDVFVYLGDLSFRYANKEDQELSQKFMASIPAGRKIFVLGNHDKMLGIDYFTKCGFDYVVEEFAWDKYIFTHRPVNMDTYPFDWWNIHGHIHNIRKYNTTDGSRNVNVYPMFYNNKPVTLDYLIKHKEELVKNNEWNPNAGYGENLIYKGGRGNSKTLLVESLTRSSSPKPVVYYSPNIDSETIAYMVALFQDRIGSRVGIKLHFGEAGNKNFLNPKLLKDLVKCTNAALIDSNTAYDGSSRGTTSGHISTARDNGFDFGYIDILDADGDIVLSVPKRYQVENELNALHNGKPGYESPVTPGRHLQEINVGSHIKNYDSLIVYTHFKGHSIAGYGGALKNIGMGIPSGKVGKKQIHGQGWEKGPLFLERLVESASAIEAMFDDKIIYVNVLANISTKCDCEKDAPKATIPDIGVLVSDDIVAIEQASIDFIRNTHKNKDIMEQIAKLGGFHQIEYMKYLGMGRSDYRLKTLDNQSIKLESRRINVFRDYFSKLAVDEVVNEGYIKDEPDLYWKRKEFNEGEINLCFITGLSGSGKSTMGADMAGKPNVDHCDMDNVVFNCNFDDKELSELGEMINAFFKGPGRQYRLAKGDLQSVTNTHRQKISNALVDFAIKYAASHKNTKFIVEGVYLFWMVSPEKLKDYAVYIKGTSSIKSAIRAAKRDGGMQDSAKDKVVIFSKTLAKKFYGMTYNTGNIDGWRKYYQDLQDKEEKKPIKESADHRLSDKETKDIISIKKSLSSEDKKFLNMSNDNDYDTSGDICFIEYDKDIPVAYFIIDIYDDYTADVSFAVRSEYQHKGYASKIVNKAMSYINSHLNEFSNIYWATKPGNVASQKLAEKAGFSIERDDYEWKTYVLKGKKPMKEAYIFNKKDIYYNRDKFNKGEINLCFITGQSGSGKSTMGKGMEGKCEVYDLDDVVWNKENFTMANLKEYGELIYTFFTGKGNKYYLTAAEIKDTENKPAVANKYEENLIKDFIDYAISWAKSHKNIKYVLEGIWIYMYIEPSKIKDYAVYIKGTSMVTSLYRASKRDNRFKSNILHPSMWLEGERGLKKYRNYFGPRAKETIHETKRSELPDSAFGIPEDRKFPLDTEQHVRSAIHLFGHAEESKKKSLARRIRSAAKKYDIRIPETTQVYKYLNESVTEIIPNGIENIIFDMGNVLVDAHTLDALLNNPNIPDEYCEEIKDFVNNKLFYGPDKDYKRKIQSLNIPEVRVFLNEELPEHIKPYVEDILATFKPAMFEYSYVPEMLDLLRNMGYRLYYLSNWDKYSFELEEEFFAPLLKKFDGGLFSFELGDILKPDREMFEALCNKYQIFANKSIFFDDKEENILAAESVGMYGYRFDKELTPKILFGTSVRIPENADDIILIADGDNGFTKKHINEFGWWYICENRKASNVDEECYYKTLEEVVRIKVNSLNATGSFTDDSPNILEYVFTNARAFMEEKTPPELVCVGQILVYESAAYEWVVQYPLKIENSLLSSLKEFSLASVNPVIGIHKPFLIKVGDQNHPELLPTDHFVYSQDIESDKVLTIDEHNHLKVKNMKSLDILEVYEFVGDRAYINRLNRLYKENASVDNFYTLLTNKPMMTEDQIDFDPSFRKIDFDLLEQTYLSELVTLRDQIMKVVNFNPLRLPVLESSIVKKPEFISKYNILGDISIKEDFDGVYFYSDLTKKRSTSVASTLQLTENMLKAIL